MFTICRTAAGGGGRTAAAAPVYDSPSELEDESSGLKRGLRSMEVGVWRSKVAEMEGHGAVIAAALESRRSRCERDRERKEAVSGRNPRV